MAPISNKLNWVLLLYRIVSFYGLKQNPNVLLQFADIQVKQARRGTWGFVPNLFFASALTAIIFQSVGLVMPTAYILIWKCSAGPGQSEEKSNGEI